MAGRSAGRWEGRCASPHQASNAFSCRSRFAPDTPCLASAQIAHLTPYLQQLGMGIQDSLDTSMCDVRYGRGGVVGSGTVCVGFATLSAKLRLR